MKPLPNPSRHPFQWFAELTVIVAFGVVIGSWWWGKGLAVVGDQVHGVRRAVTVAWRVSVLGAAVWVVEQPGEVRWLGFAVLCLCGAAGWFAYLRWVGRMEQQLAASPSTRTAAALRPSELIPGAAHPDGDSTLRR
ncbi:hypothetical protein DLJ47_28875 [Micromonospora sp. S4605]|uniref:hypothetical protein n=1 Tax=Micromonospora sp. S4605 TaxID=1420897 RepID=UPI000D6EC700|nr:hypothetical protein [Micromonospora sp. S4605]PWU48112.1 hypothetical protein DLJ47_28875 [Micromonospora sp. S4605]